jgi:hypothetical protein
MANRTDGVPEIGDPFHDPNSMQKWAEFNTAPEVKQRVPKIDVNKENRLWYYLGKTATEARPQYTEDLAKPRHNIKSSFLDAVKPSPRPIPPFDRRSYPASYPIQPSPLSNAQRTPLQPNIRPAAAPIMTTSSKAYQYKPRELTTAYKTPGYNHPTETWKNPNSPVAHQPNVVYDYRATAPQYGHPSYSNGYHQYRPPQQSQPPVQQYHGYAPPQSYQSNGWKPPTTSAAPLPDIDQYAQSQQLAHALPPYPYYHTETPSNPRQLPPFPYSHAQGSTQGSTQGHTQSPAQGPPGPTQGSGHRPAYDSRAHHTPVSQAQSSSRGPAPMSSMLGTIERPNNPPMYADTPPSSCLSTAPAPLSSIDYIVHVSQYPYLKNAFLRRAKTYISPYSPIGGFTPEWRPQVGSTSISGPNLTATRAPSASRPAQPNQGLGLSNLGGPPAPPSLPISMSRPVPQFQSQDAFQRDLSRAPAPPAGGMANWEHRFKQLGASGPPSLPPSLAASPQIPLSRPSNLSHETKNGTTPVRSHTPTLPPPNESQRPIPSPLSEASRSPKRPEYSPISDDGKGPGSNRPALPPLVSLQNGDVLPSGETWRYT